MEETEEFRKTIYKIPKNNQNSRVRLSEYGKQTTTAKND